MYRGISNQCRLWLKKDIGISDTADDILITTWLRNNQLYFGIELDDSILKVPDPHWMGPSQFFHIRLNNFMGTLKSSLKGAYLNALDLFNFFLNFDFCFKSWWFVEVFSQK